MRGRVLSLLAVNGSLAATLGAPAASQRVDGTRRCRVVADLSGAFPFGDPRAADAAGHLGAALVGVVDPQPLPRGGWIEARRSGTSASTPAASSSARSGVTICGGSAASRVPHVDVRDAAEHPVELRAGPAAASGAKLDEGAVVGRAEHQIRPTPAPS